MADRSARTSHPFAVRRPHPAPIGSRSLGGPIAVCQPLLAPPNRPLRIVSANANSTSMAPGETVLVSVYPSASIPLPTRGHLTVIAGAIVNNLLYPLRSAVLRDAVRDAQGDRRLAFILFSRWAGAHPRVAGIQAIAWAWKRLAPAMTPTPYLTGSSASEGMAHRGAGLVLPAPQKEAST